MSSKEERIAVLMSTYNGEKYIEEQIESILAQKGVQLRLYVRDDGSTDRTMDIIKAYERKHKLTVVPAKKNLGPEKSFMVLLFEIFKIDSYDYFSFADQDDIWLPDKLRIAIEMLRKVKDIPALYGSNRIIYRNGKQEGLVYRYPVDNSLQRHMTDNEVSGCTMVMNRDLTKEIVAHPCFPDFRLHDVWISLVAILKGTIIYDPQSYILYRIHENNVVGDKKIGWKERLNRLFLRGKDGKRRANIRRNTARVLLNYYPEVGGEHRRILEEYAYYQNSLKNKLLLMHDRELIRATGENKWIFCMKVLANYV